MKMKLAIAIVLVLGAWLIAQTVQTATPLAGYFPAGPMLYVEARDFSALLKDWGGSPEKRLWLRSDNYSVFSRTRLFTRLTEAQGEYETAAGLPADMSLVNSIAGTESAIAIYDIGKLEFLYVSRLASARAVETALWKTRTSYESRNAAGQPYYVRIDRASKRVAAFASVDGLLLLATREDLIAGALTLIAKQPGRALTQDRFFDQATKAAKGQGEIRMVMNMPSLLTSPQFRSYWIQRNTSTLKQYSAGIADLFRDAGQIREERVLLRSEPRESMASAETAVSRILAYVPNDAGLYRAWASPSTTDAADLVYRKIYSPAAGAPPPSEIAPDAASPDQIAGTETDLETRIDQAPLNVGDRNKEYNDLRVNLAKMKIDAMVEMQSSRTLPDGVFVVNPRAVILLAASDWDANAIRTEFSLAQGRVLVLADNKPMLDAIAQRLTAPPVPQLAASYAASFRLGQELTPYTKMMRLIDHSHLPEGTSQEPQFFSQNVASLGRTLSRVESASITVHDNGATVPQTVLYKFTK
jgi:hypothetical protein